MLVHSFCRKPSNIFQHFLISEWADTHWQTSSQRIGEVKHFTRSIRLKQTRRCLSWKCCIKIRGSGDIWRLTWHTNHCKSALWRAQLQTPGVPMSLMQRKTLSFQLPGSRLLHFKIKVMGLSKVIASQKMRKNILFKFGVAWDFASKHEKRLQRPGHRNRLTCYIHTAEYLFRQESLQINNYICSPNMHRMLTTSVYFVT